MAKVLITGGAGYIGSVLAPMILSEGHEVTIFDSFMYGALPLLGFSAHPKLSIIKGDVRDATALARAVKGQDWILHLAAIVGYPACAADPHLSVTTNVDGTKNVLDAMGQGQRLIFASTGFDLRQGARRGVRGDSHRTIDALRQDQARRRDANPRFRTGSMSSSASPRSSAARPGCGSTS